MMRDHDFSDDDGDDAAALELYDSAGRTLGAGGLEGLRRPVAVTAPAVAPAPARSAAAPAPQDQADGLRRLFAGQGTRFVAVASNPHVVFSGVMLERLTAAIARLGRHTLVVDASEDAPEPQELARVDLGRCIEPLTRDTSYLAARGLALRHVDTRGSTAAFLDALTDAAPLADVVLVHAPATDLSRLFARRPLRPLLLAADSADSITHAYGSMKLLAVRNRLLSFDLLLGAPPRSPRCERIAQQLSSCADNFLTAVLHDWAAVDPACDVNDPLEADLLRVTRALLEPARVPDADDDWLPGARTGAMAFSLNRN